MKLNLGSGSKPLKGYINVDYYNDQADLRHDLNVFPYPFATGTVEEIVMDNSLEHLDNIITVMEELHRICANNAKLTIIVPYFRSKWAYIDPTHKHFFTLDSMNYFVDGHEFHKRYKFTNCKFAMERKAFNENLNRTLFQKMLIPFATKYKKFYENSLSPIWPLEILTYHMRVIK